MPARRNLVLLKMGAGKGMWDFRLKFRAPLYHLNHAAAGVKLQTKAYPMHPLYFSHAVRCLATAEGIPYASFLHPLSLARRPVSRDS
jgi:hypothetical protein